MSRWRFFQNNFLVGEVTPKAFSRTDLEEYVQGNEIQENFLTLVQGGASRRPGTQFVASEAQLYTLQGQTAGTAIGSSQVWDDEVRLVPFVVSNDTVFICVLGIDSGTGDSTIAIFDAHSLSEATFTAGSSVTAAGPTFAGFNSVSELKSIQYAQNGDRLILTHPNHPPIVITRTAASNFKIDPLWRVSTGSNVQFRAMPYLTTNTSSQTITVTGAGPYTLTASSSLFDADHVGTNFKVTDSPTTYVYNITGYTSATVVTAERLRPTSGSPAGAETDWAEGAWSDFRGYPRAVTFHEQRSVFGGTSFSPDTVWLSQIGDFIELDGVGLAQDTGFATVTADEAFNFTVASTEVNEVQFLSSGSSLIIGTLGREYIAKGVSSALSPLDISVTAETAQGSAFVQPLRVENVLVFVQRSGQKVREFIFNRDEDAYRTNDLTYLADHIAKRTSQIIDPLSGPSIIQMAYQANDNSIIWFLDSDGGLFGLTRSRENKVKAWHYHKLGGLLDGNPAYVQSLSVVPSADNTHDDLWMAVKRTINGGEVIHIERILKDFQGDSLFNSSTSQKDKPIYSDSAKMVRLGSPDVTFAGFDHLEGETVQILADGIFVGTKVVTSGDIVLDDDATEVLAGLAYTSTIKTLKIDRGSILGTSQGAINRIDRVMFRFLRTVGAKFGTDDNTETILFRKANFQVDQPIPLFSDDKTLEFSGAYERAVQVIVQQDLPLPCTITGIAMRGLLYD